MLFIGEDEKPNNNNNTFDLYGGVSNLMLIKSASYSQDLDLSCVTTEVYNTIVYPVSC